MNHIFADEEILTREEVMDVLKIGRSTFYKLLQSGNLKGFTAIPLKMNNIRMQ